MAGSANKKVEIVRFDRTTLSGFIQVPEGLTGGRIELLTPEGNLIPIPFEEAKAVCFVRDFDSAAWTPHRGFQTRPKSPGLWIRMRFRDGDWLEGTIPNNLMLLEGDGVAATPPDPNQLQRVFVPRPALESVEVLGVIGSSVRRRPAKPTEKEPDAQIPMFE